MNHRRVLLLGLPIAVVLLTILPVSAQTPSTPMPAVSSSTTSTGLGAATTSMSTKTTSLATTMSLPSPSSSPTTAQSTTTTISASSSSFTTAVINTTVPITNNTTTPPTAPATTTPATSPTTTTTPTTPPAVQGDTPKENWSVYFGGDTLLTRRVARTANPFARIRPPLDQADLTIVNVETAIATVGKAEVKTFTFRSDLSLPNRLAAAGVDVVSLANNHAIDYGKPAMLETITRLRAAKVNPVGAGENLKEALTPVELTIGGQRVAVLAASQIIPSASWVAGRFQAGIASAGKHVIDRNTQNLLQAVRDAKATNDVVFVVLHWGIEGDFCPSGVQRKLGAQLRAAGATAVLGAHPHVLQPVVVDEGRANSAAQGKGLIAYSMGNFIWDPRGGASGETGLLELKFTGADLAGHQFHPHRLDRNGWASAVNPSSAIGKRISARTAKPCPGAKGSSGS